MRDGCNAGILVKLKVLVGEEGDPRNCRIWRLQTFPRTHIGSDRRRRQTEQPPIGQCVFQRLPDKTEAATLIVIGQAQFRRHAPFHAR